MPTFDFTSPEGKTYSVEGPDGATPEQAFSILQQHLGQQPSAPVTGTGLAKAAGSGLAEGAIGLAGTPGDIRDLHKLAGSKIGDYLGISPETQAKIGTGYDTALRALGNTVGPMGMIAANGPDSAQIKNAVEQNIGKLYQPQNAAESTAHTVASFVPAAALGEDAIIPRLIKQAVIPGLASEGAGQATAGTAAEPYARAAAAIGAGGAASAVKSAPNVAKNTIQDVEKAGVQGFKAPEVSNVTFTPGTMNDVSNIVTNDLKRARLNDRLAPQTHAVLEDLKTPVNGPAHTYEDVQTTRELLGKLAGNFANPTESAAATQAIKTLDKVMEALPQSRAATGDLAAMNATIQKARGDYAAAKTAGRVQDKLNNADLRAGSTYSGGNLNNATRQDLRTLLTSKKGQRGLTDDELQSIEDTVRGSALGNAARLAGNKLTGLTANVAAHALGGFPANVATMGVGYGVKKIGNAITRANADKIVQQILSRSPTGMANAVPPIPPDRLAMLKRILLANSATLPLRLPLQQASQAPGQ